MEKRARETIFIGWNISIKAISVGVPAVAQWANDPACLCRSAIWFPGLVWWVKDLALLQPWRRSCLDSIPGLGTSICLESGWEKKKKQFQCILWFMDMSHSYTSSAGEKRQFWKTKKTVQLGFSKSRFWSFCQYVLFCYDSWHSVIIFQAPTIPGHQGHSILLCASLFLMC